MDCAKSGLSTGTGLGLASVISSDVGEHNVEQELDERKLHEFTQALLADLRALAFMLEDGRTESGVRRIGAEQEMFLVDRSLQPAPLALEVLERADDARLTTEIARFNLEANLTPLELTGRCFHSLHEELEEVLAKARLAATDFGVDVLLAGILPTLRVSDLTLENLTPIPRYHELNRSVTGLRREPFSIHIKGLDELQLTHDNMMMESCNTSFQVHFQVNPSDFVVTYNIAQAITALTKVTRNGKDTIRDQPESFVLALGPLGNLSQSFDPIEKNSAK